MRSASNKGAGLHSMTKIVRESCKAVYTSSRFTTDSGCTTIGLLIQ